ncbi:MAG: helix-turn-helix domain-containing protein [Chitinispirillaceae bacterium]|jgi:excisionase family DNA binding protein
METYQVDKKNNSGIEPEFYTPEELAELLRIPKRTLEKWALKKQIPVIKVGRLNRFPRLEIQKRLLNGTLLK